MRPVSAEFPINQPFGSMKTAGVVGDINRPNTVEYYVARYGNYQPYGHAGADFKCPEGTPVHAIAAGTVLWADWGTKLPGDDTNFGYRRRWYLYKNFPGIVTVIQHAGWIGVYAHLSAAHMTTGDTVTEAQVIGLSGGTGGVAPHLHVEALVDLTYKTSGGLIYGRTDPEPFFGSAITTQGTITPQEDDVANTDIELQEAAQTVLRDNVLVKGGRSVAGALTQLIDSTDIIGERDLKQLEELAALKELIGQLVKSTAANQSTYYLKGDAKPEVYALDVATGKLRHVQSAEFDVVTAVNIYKTVDQAKVDALLASK